MAAAITGDKALDRKLKRMRQSVQTKLTKAAIRAGLSVAAKEMKKSLPSRYKDARKGIGWALKKSWKTGIMEGKVGSTVGKKRDRINKWGRVILDKRKAEGKKGLGLSPATFHWWILGNRNMSAKLPGMAKNAMRGGQSAAVTSAMAKKWRSGIMREAAKKA